MKIIKVDMVDFAFTADNKYKEEYLGNLVTDGTSVYYFARDGKIQTFLFSTTTAIGDLGSELLYELSREIDENVRRHVEKYTSPETTEEIKSGELVYINSLIKMKEGGLF